MLQKFWHMFPNFLRYNGNGLPFLLKVFCIMYAFFVLQLINSGWYHSPSLHGLLLKTCPAVLDLSLWLFNKWNLNPSNNWINYLNFIQLIMQVELSMQISYLHFRFKLNTRSSWLKKFTCGECLFFPVTLNNSFVLPISYEALFASDFQSQSIFKSSQVFHISPYLYSFKTINYRITQQKISILF